MRATFGVSASCFAANVAAKHNAIELADKYPLAAATVPNHSFCVDTVLTGADDMESARSSSKIRLFMEVSCSESGTLVSHSYSDLRESREVHLISSS